MWGNPKAFTAVRVPTPAEEQAREAGSLRDQLKKSRHQWEACGRSLLLYQGRHVTGQRWAKRHWDELQPTLPAWLATELEAIRAVLLLLDGQEKARRKALEAKVPKKSAEGDQCAHLGIARPGDLQLDAV